MRCLKEQCKYYFLSDIFETCNLADEPVREECIGFKEIIPKKEKIMCKIGELLKEYDELCDLETKLIK